jgi:hypothetical protein
MARFSYSGHLWPRHVRYYYHSTQYYDSRRMKSYLVVFVARAS